MTRVKLFIKIVYLLAIVGVVLPAEEVLTGTWKGEAIRYKDLHAIIGVTEDSKRPVAYTLIQSLGYTLVDSFSVINAAVIRMDNSKTFLEDVNDLDVMEELHYAEPIMYGDLCTEIYPNDPYFIGTDPTIGYPHQWPLHNDGLIIPDPSLPPIGIYDEDIDAPEAWAVETGSSNVKIAILDTGIPFVNGHLTHPDLDNPARFLPGVDFTADLDHGINDNNGHGTHIMGIIGAQANNEIGIAGIDWHAQITAHKIAGGDEFGPGPASINVGQALVYSINNGVNVINLSWRFRPHSVYVEQALFYAMEAPVPPVIVCGTGNDVGSPVGCPAHHIEWGSDLGHVYENGYPNILSVGATNPTGDVAVYSSWTDDQYQVSVVAPGGVSYVETRETRVMEQVFSTWAPSQGDPPYYEFLSGTSMAVPHVTGLASLVFARFPGISAEEVCEVIMVSAEDTDGGGRDFRSGYGRINAFYAVAPPAAPQTLRLTGTGGQHPQLTWDANDEPDLTSYQIYRKEGTGNWVNIRTVNNTTTTWADNGVTIGDKFDPWVYYKITAEDYTEQESPYSNSVSTRLGSTSKEIAGANQENNNIPTRYDLSEVYPNPFNPSTTIMYELPEVSNVSIVIYDMLGRTMWNSSESAKAAGYYPLKWDGLNNSGNQVTSGI